MPTFYSMATRPPNESWRAIRTARAEPQGRVAFALAQKDRQREFHMALDQAQQQFNAASQIGYESRPLNLYYGAAQAGRALAAASHRLGSPTDPTWRGSGHGLKFDTNFQATDLWQQSIRQDASKTDLFSLVSRAIDSPSAFATARFGAAVNQLPDYAFAFRDPEGEPRPITDMYVSDRALPLSVEIRVPGLPPTGDLTESRVRGLLAPYPALANLQLERNEDGTVRRSHNADRCWVRIDDPNDLIRDETGLHLRGTTLYRGTAMLMPTIGTATEPLSPLMTWWLTLFALSMLARYAPSTWTQVLSIADSSVASRVELLLDEALAAVPELIHQELEALS